MELKELVNTIVSDCYRGNIKNAYSNIQKFIDKIVNYNCDEKMLFVLKNILDAMEQGDTVLLGDLFEHGVKRFLEGREIPIDLIEQAITCASDIREDVICYRTNGNELSICIMDPKGTMRRMGSFISPEREVDICFNDIEMNKQSLAVCLFGLGTGLLAKRILDNLNESGIMIIYEPCRIIYDYFMKEDSLHNLSYEEMLVKKRINTIMNDKRVRIVVEDTNELEFRSLLSNQLDYIHMMGLVTARHNNYDLAFPKQALYFYNSINDFIIRTRVSHNTGKLFRDDYVDNFFQNIHYLKDVSIYNTIADIVPEDIPVIIVSAGPSLDKNIEILKQAKGHLFIIAVDTAIRTLLKNGVIPDLTITIDPIKPETFYPDGASLDIPCLFTLDSNYKIVSRLRGKKFIVNLDDEYALRLLKRIHKEFGLYVANGCSVATAAFGLMVMLERKKIILVGQDLAFENGKTHAGGIDDQAGYAEVWVDGINEEKVKTRYDWLTYLKWFENSIKAYNSLGMELEVIDATEGGALIHGTKVMSLKEAIDSCRDENGKLPNYNWANELNKASNYFSEEEYDLLCNAHREAIVDLKDIILKSDEAIRICDNLLKNINSDSASGKYVDREKQKISKINEYCSGKEIFPLINRYVVFDIASDMGNLLLEVGDVKTVEMNGIKMMKLSFEAIKKAAKCVYDKGIKSLVL